MINLLLISYCWVGSEPHGACQAATCVREKASHVIDEWRLMSTREWHEGWRRIENGWGSGKGDIAFSFTPLLPWEVGKRKDEGTRRARREETVIRRSRETFPKRMCLTPPEPLSPATLLSISPFGRNYILINRGLIPGSGDSIPIPFQLIVLLFIKNWGYHFNTNDIPV